MKTFKTDVEVRGYELDSYKHVNHAVYISYLEHARWKMLEEAGVTLSRLDGWKRWPVIASLEARYLKPTFIGDRLTIETEVIEHRRVGFKIRQVIRRGEEAVLEATIGAVMVNEAGRPAEVPEEMRKLWETF